MTDTIETHNKTHFQSGGNQNKYTSKNQILDYGKKENFQAV